MTTATRRLGRMSAVAAGAAVTAMVLAGCATGGSDNAAESGALTPFSYQTSWIPMVQFGGTYVAEDAGYFEDNGLDVEVLPGGPEADVTALVASGKVDIGVSNADYVARANAEGADLVIVGAGFQKNPLSILSLADAPVTDPADMAGKKIGATSSGTAAIDALLTLNDVPADQVEQVPVGFDVAPLLGGEVDGLIAFYTEQPIAVEEAGQEPYTFLLADYDFDVFAQVYVVTRETLDTKRDLVEDFMTAEAKGWQDFIADPTAGIELAVNEYGKDGGLTVEQQTKQAERQADVVVTDETTANGLLTMSEDAIQKNINTLEALGIDGVDASLFDASVMADVYNGTPTL